MFFSFFLLFPFFFSSLPLFFQSSKQTPKTEKNRREVPVVKMTIFLYEKFDFGASVDRVLGMAYLR